MCGIVGILARNGRLPPELLERATKSLEHRGPDDSGTVIIQDTKPESIELGLGNRRLAILDLSPAGHQPMQDPATGNWIVYNGEIYNFAAIRKKLEQDGVHFEGHCDTEVILAAYGRWGVHCLSELRGIFAIAIWDAKQHRLFLARDPMGIKPLYYYASTQHFLFASEVRTLLVTGLVPKRLDGAGLLNYLTFGSVCDPNTLVESVLSLPPGHYMVWDGGTTTTTQYWDLTDGDRDSAGSAEAAQAALARLPELLEESVRLQLVSDVPVGVFLSGGIDSSSIVGLLARGGAHLNTFSLVFREADHNEAVHSRAIATQFNTEHHEITVSQNDALAAIPAALAAMDQPSIDGLNSFLISRQVRQAGVTVALSGLGGDELFGGYESFHTVPRMERFVSGWKHVPRLLRLAFAAAYAGAFPKSDRNQKLAALARDDGRLLHPYFLARMLFTPAQRDRLLAQSDAPYRVRADAPLRDRLARARHLDPINRVSYLEARCYMLNTLLRDTDCMSMAASLEVRVPLIDHKLAENLFAIAGSVKLAGDVPKSLLVNALGGALPDSIVRRPKQGFTLPFAHWLCDELRPGVESTIRQVGQGPLASFFDARAAGRVWEQFLNGDTSWSRPWSLYVLHRWCELNL